MIDLLPSMNYAYNYICCQLTKGQFTERAMFFVYFNFFVS